MRLLDLRLRVLRGLRTMRRAAPAFSVTDLDVFRYLRFLRHLGKVMLLVVFGLAWLEVEAVIQCSLAPAWRQGGLFARLAVVMTSLLLCFLVRGRLNETGEGRRPGVTGSVPRGDPRASAVPHLPSPPNSGSLPASAHISTHIQTISPDHTHTRRLSCCSGRIWQHLRQTRGWCRRAGSPLTCRR